MKPSFSLSADTRFVYQKLRELAVGSTATRDDLAALIDVPAQSTRLNAAIASARRKLLHEENMVFGTIRGVGLKRLDDTEIVGTAAATTRKIRRAARKGVKTLSSVQDFSALSRAEQMRHSASLSIFGAVAEISRERSVQKIEKAIDPAKRDLPFRQTLAMFREDQT